MNPYIDLALMIVKPFGRFHSVTKVQNKSSLFLSITYRQNSVFPVCPPGPIESEIIVMATESQINANRANAQHSTGPSTPEGKLKSSHNAVKTGLTGRTILLPSDDVGAYENFVEILKRKYQPYDDYEKHLAQSIADTEWRLLRIPTLESGYYALGRHELAGECAHEPNEQVRSAMLEALIDRTYKKDLRNLALQERRLRAQLAKFVAELAQLQEEREALQFQRRNRVMNPVGREMGFKPPANFVELFGFEFTDEFLDTRLEAYNYGGIEAVKQLDRAWKAMMRKKAA
jgi:hypothetical protein